MTVAQIVEEIVKIKNENDSENKDIGKKILQANKTDAEADLEMYKCMKMTLLEFPPLLTKNGELANKRRDNTPDFIYSNLDEVVGKRFKNQVYRYLSKGLVSPDFLESLSNQELLTDSLVAPSNLNKAVWDSEEYKHLFKITVHNFLKEKDHVNPRETLGTTQQMLEQKGIKIEKQNLMDLYLEETVIQEEIAR